MYEGVETAVIVCANRSINSQRRTIRPVVDSGQCIVNVGLEQWFVSIVAASSSSSESEQGVRCYGGTRHYAPELLVRAMVALRHCLQVE